MAVNANTTTILGSYNAMVPKEGPKVVPVNAQLASNQSVIIDLTQLQQQGKISFIQGLMVDNSQSTAAITITSQAFNQNIVVPAGAQAILPVFVINPPVFIATSTGGKNIPLFFFNIPLPAQVWNQGTGPFSFSGNNLLVSDPALEALIANLGGGNGLGVNVLTTTPTPSVNIVEILQVTSTGAATLTSAAAGAANHWYVTGFDVALTSNATLAAAAENALTLEFGSGPTVFWQTNIYIPNAAVANAIGDIFIMSRDLPVPIRSAALNDTVKAVIGGVALTAGHFIVNVHGYAAP